MRTLVLSFLLALCFQCIPNPSIAQRSNLEVFISEVKPFYLILNGKQMNDKPQTNISLQVPIQRYEASIIFEDQRTPACTARIRTSSFRKAVYKIKRKGKKKYIIKRL